MLVCTNNVNLNEGMIVAVVIAILSNCKLTPPPPLPKKKSYGLCIIAVVLFSNWAMKTVTLGAGQFCWVHLNPWMEWNNSEGINIPFAFNKKWANQFWRPNWTTKQRPCLCSRLILCELNLFYVKTSFRFNEFAILLITWVKRLYKEN